MKKLNELQSYLTRLRGLMLTLIILCSIGSGNAWGVDYTYSFTINAGDFNTTSYAANNNEKTSTATCTTDGSKTMSVKWTSYQVMKNSSNMQWQKSKGYIYNSTDLGTINSVTVTSSAGSFTTYYGTSEQPSSGSAGSGKGYFKTSVGGATGTTSQIVINFTISEGGGSTPSLTPTPTSLDWGTVLQGSSQSTKTITITGANLTAGTLTISATGGYSVTPTSKSVSGTLAATTLTVTPPSTASTGTKNGKVTISGGGLASNVEVNLSMTVNAASTVTWMNNGSEYTTTLVANGSKPEFPSNPSSCDGTSTTFVGWTPTPWSGKLDDVSAKTIYTSGAAMPNVGGAVTYHAVFAAQSDFTRVNNTSELATGKLLVIVDAYNSKTLNTDLSASTAPTETSGKITPSANMIWTLEANSTNWKLKTGSNYLKGDANPTSSSKTKTISLGTSGNLTWVIASNSYTNNGTPVFSIRNSSSGNAGLEYSSGWKLYYTTNLNTSYYTEKLYISSYSKYLTTCCTDPGLNYGTGSVTKTFGDAVFTNTLTNSHGVAVTYSSSDETVATVNGSGQVTILKAGSTTITASSIAQTVSTVDYCADEASYTLTVNKADISPTLSYTPNSVAVGENTSAPTVGGNPGSGGVTYAITSATPAGCATIDAGTGVVTGVAVGSVTVTATVAATANYNGNTATATVTINAASNFPNNRTIFIQAHSSSAWDASACVVAWFHSYGGSETAQSTYWLFDATGGDAGKKLFAAIVPASGNLPYLDINRFASDCSTPWNKNGGVSYSDASGSNAVRSEGSGNDQVYWNASGVTLDLHGDPSGDAWASSLASFSDQGNGVWTASYNNYAPANAAGESQDFKVKTNYNGWIGNTGSNNNATLDGMHVGSTYNITATLDVKDHSLTMSKTFVKGTVHFDLQGHGSAISDLTNVAAGSKISAPSTPSATGYDFGGWYKEPACTNAWNFGSDVVNETMTLYAKWTKHTYTISSTLNHCSSSPAIPSSYEYTGTAAGLSYTITPSSGYRLPTTITVTGTTYTWNSTTGALVLTGTIASNVTITITAVQTHTVDWYVGGSAPANKIGDDGQTTVVDHGGKIEDFPAHDPDGSACDKTFVGWTNTSSYVHGTSPLFNDVAGSPTINANASFYAVFAEVNSVSASLTKMTADDDLEVGDKIVIIAQDTRYGMYQASASSYVSYWTTTDMDGEPSLSEIEADDKKYLDVAAGSASNTWKLGDATNGYLYNASSTNLEFSTTNSSDLTLITWTDDSFTLQAGQYISCRTDITGANANKWRGAGASCDPENDNNCSGTEYYYLYKYVPGGTTYTGHTITCADCGTSVTPTFTAAPAGGTVAVTRSGNAVTSGSTVKTCTSQDLSVTITPASHYTLTGFTATGLTTGTATISPTVGSVLPTTSAQTFTVTVSASATGTLNLTPVLTEDAHKVISWVVHGSSASIADGHGTTWVYSGENLTAIPDAPDAPTGCDDKEFVGWSENDGGATEGDASDYTDLFTTLGGAPTGITTNRTFYAVFATPAAGLGGTVMWEEDFSGFSANDAPNTSYGSAHTGTTVYNSGSVTYACTNGGSDTKVYTSQISAGGTSPELLVGKNTGVFAVTNIPTGGQTELTLTYKSNKSANDFTVTSGTSGVTIGDASNSGTTYTRTITISQSPSATNSFALSFSMTANSNARLDDISLVVPGSSSSSAYVTTCEETYTITYNKNTTDPVTNLPSPTGISQATGSGTLSSKVPVRYAYTFMGWATTAEGSVAYAAGAAISSVGADMTLYAVWEETAVTEINLSKSSLDKYVGDPSVTLTVTSVLPDGASTDVIWSSSNSSIATVSASGEVNFIAAGTATITATSSITSGTTATCAVTVWAKPSVSFLDNLHSLTEDKDGNALSGYNLTDVAGTPVVFPILANQPAGSGTCEDEFYVFIGWTTSDNNTDPEDHLVTSHNLTNGDNITYYAVWADGVAGTTYTKLTSSTFKTSPAKYVIGAEYNGTTRYFYSCEKTDKNNSWGYVTADLANNSPIEFTLSGTAAALVATSTEVSARYLKPMAEKDFQMSASSQTVELKSDGTIYNPVSTSWKLLYNNANSLRWYDSNISGSANAYFYEVVAGGEVNYRTSCCADKVAAPTVTATKTSTTVTLTWAAVSGATGYELQWNGGAWTAATSGVVKSDLTPNTNYSWRVRATYDPPKCGADIASGNTTTNQVYHVTYAKGSGTGSCNATGSTTDGTAYEAGATVTLQSNGFTLVGHTFNEWTEDDEDITISSNQFTMPEHDVVITATWTPKVDKFYDRMHDGTDASHGGTADGDGKYYITREGCSYTVPSLTDNTSGATACHTKHYVLMGWTAESHLNSDGTLRTGHEGYVYTGGGTQTATGATYYAVWAEVEE